MMGELVDVAADTAQVSDDPLVKFRHCNPYRSAVAQKLGSHQVGYEPHAFAARTVDAHKFPQARNANDALELVEFELVDVHVKAVHSLFRSRQRLWTTITHI